MRECGETTDKNAEIGEGYEEGERFSLSNASSYSEIVADARDVARLSHRLFGAMLVRMYLWSWTTTVYMCCPDLRHGGGNIQDAGIVFQETK